MYYIHRQVIEMQMNEKAYTSGKNEMNGENKGGDGDSVGVDGLKAIKDEIINNAYPFAKNGNSTFMNFFVYIHVYMYINIFMYYCIDMYI
jgi:hypothetical protein